MYSEDVKCDVPSKENLYLSIISKCRREIDEIRNRTTIFLSPQKVENCTDTPSRTELENSLNSLLSKIQDLKNDIVI